MDKIETMNLQGQGVFATKPFKNGETTLVGKTKNKLATNIPITSQVNLNEFALYDEITRIVNHSCAPNCGIRVNSIGAHDFVAIRDIVEGEELTFDYAMMSYTINYFPSKCNCGSVQCRGEITGWKDLSADKKKEYKSWSAPYLLELDKEKELSDIDFFIKEGYIIIRQKDLNRFDSREVNEFQQNIKEYREILRKFFSLPSEEKKLIESKYGTHPVTKCHYAGYRGKSTYTNKKGVNFCMEYFHSRNFYKNSRDNMCIPEEASEEIATKLKAYLPNKAAYEITNFIRKNFIHTFLGGFCTKNGVPTPKTTIQIQCTYYPDKSKLGIHQDTAFFEGIIGPATGLIIQPGGRNEKLHVDLAIGETILYTGLQFNEVYKEKVKDVPFPLLHAVEAEAGRISLPFACFHY